MSERMGPVDAAWLHMDQPTNLMIVTALLWLEEPPDWDAVVQRLADRLPGRFPRFRQQVTDHRLGAPRWQDDPLFDIDLHVQRVALPPPGDDAALQDFVGEVMSQDLDRRRPLWHAWLVDGYGDGAAIVVRIHHCVADGVALMRVLLSLTEPIEAVPAEPSPTAGTETAHPVHSARDALRHGLADVGKVVHAIRTGAGIVGAVVHDARLPPDHLTAFRGEQSARKVAAWSSGLPLSTVKDAAHARGATVNDVLLAALSGALGWYLRDVGTPTTQIRALVPVNLRPLDEQLPETLGNRFGLVFCPLPVGVTDPDERLTAVKAAMDTIKGTPEAITSFGLLASMGLSPTAVEDVMVEFFGTKSSLVVTNVPGPRQPVSIAGTPVAGVLSWAPQSGPVSASVTIVSYAGSVVVGFATDPALVADPERLVRAFEEEVEALADSSAAT